jgi:hypothetical protein
MTDEAVHATGAQQSARRSLPVSHFVLTAMDVLWRRRHLFLLPILIALPLAIAFVKLGPRPYVAQGLLLLQENARDNPLVREAMPAYVNMQDRVNGLQALMRSERVLTAALADIHGMEVLSNRARAEQLKRQLALDLNLYLVGSDFLIIELRDTAPVGLGKRLESVLARFLEALLPSEDARGVLKDMHQFPAAEGSTAGIAPSVLKAPERIKLIDPPRDPVLPATSGLRIVLGAFALSLVVAAGLVALAEILDTTVRSQAQFERITGLAVLTRLPVSGETADALPQPAASAESAPGKSSRAQQLTRVFLLLTFVGIGGIALAEMGALPGMSGKSSLLAALDRGGR